MSVQGLVDRIGGAARLREILVTFYARLVVDPIVGFFFAGRAIEPIIDGQHAFLMRAFGASERYFGKNPLLAHTELPPILRGHFDRRLKILREVLEAAGLDPVDVDGWIKVENGFRRRLVTTERFQ